MNSHELFFREQYIPLLKNLKGDEKGRWGLLSAQGMVEHMTDSIGVSWGRVKQELQTPEGLLAKFREFALGDKEFKPGTKNALMGDKPAPLRNHSMEAAIAELEEEVRQMLAHYQKHPTAVITNPFFGDFNYQEWLHLLHKHARHHLKQFNLM